VPWEKQFNVDDVLEKAMRTFWSKGYDATSMQDLVESMGINRGSIYDTFGDKRSLFLEALRRYDDVERKNVLVNISNGRTPRATIRALLDAIISDTVVRKNRDGCFLVNSALELAPHDKDVAKIVSSGFKDIEDFFYDLIREGRIRGEFSKDINARNVSRMLLASIIGIRVISRSWPEKAVLNSIASQAMCLLE